MTEPSYDPTDWQNQPATATPLGRTLLNKIEQGIKAVTDRVVVSLRLDQTQPGLIETNRAFGRANLGLGTMAVKDAADYIPATTTALPTYVGTRAKSWDPRSSLYNGTAVVLRKLRALLSSTRQGGTCRITFIGDSTTAGAGADALTSWPIQLRGMLAAAGCPVKGSGATFAGQGITDSRWVKTGTTTDFGQMSQMAASSTKTFTSTVPGDTAEIRFYRTSGAFDLLVDGAVIATGVTVTGGTYNTSTGRVTPDGASSAGKVTISGLALATHAVKVTSVATTFLITANVYAGSAAGVAFSNMGVASTKSADWTGTGFASDYQMATLEPADCFFVALGVNDGTAAVPVATYKTNLTTIITNLLTIAPVVLVAQINSSAITAADQQAYVNAIYDVADALDLPVLDLMHRWGSYAALNALGLIADTVHMNAKGYADWALAVAAGLQLGGGGSTAAGNGNFISWDGTGTQPLRPPTAATVPVVWICPTQPTGGGTTAGGAGSVDGLDIWIRTP